MRRGGRSLPSPPLVRVTTSSWSAISSALLSYAESRLRAKRDISRCKELGVKVYAKHFLLIVAPSASPACSRFAVAVTTKLDKRATRRNRLKRQLREVFRELIKDLLNPVDVLIVARNGSLECEYAEIRDEIVSALRAKRMLSRYAQ